jgi:hypothetical protein
MNGPREELVAPGPGVDGPPLGDRGDKGLLGCTFLFIPDIENGDLEGDPLRAGAEEVIDIDMADAEAAFDNAARGDTGDMGGSGIRGDRCRWSDCGASEDVGDLADGSKAGDGASLLPDEINEGRAVLEEEMEFTVSLAVFEPERIAETEDISCVCELCTLSKLV